MYFPQKQETFTDTRITKLYLNAHSCRSYLHIFLPPSLPFFLPPSLRLIQHRYSLPPTTPPSLSSLPFTLSIPYIVRTFLFLIPLPPSSVYFYLSISLFLSFSFSLSLSLSPSISHFSHSLSLSLFLSLPLSLISVTLSLSLSLSFSLSLPLYPHFILNLPWLRSPRHPIVVDPRVSSVWVDRCRSRQLQSKSCAKFHTQKMMR